LSATTINIAALTALAVTVFVTVTCICAVVVAVRLTCSSVDAIRRNYVVAANDAWRQDLTV
jgi:hypothetical protein